MSYDKLFRYSEKFSPSGNPAAEGILKQLGKPRLDPVHLYVREAIQNSWDARLPGSDHIRFMVHGWRLTRDQRDLLRDSILADRAPGVDHDVLWKGREGPMVLAVADRGTFGLSGPTRADLQVGEDPPNFVRFLRNVGQTAGKGITGGTYGFGKAVHYLASNVHTVLIHSRIRRGGRTAGRFMAAAIAHSATVARGSKFGNYTGRHWWGAPGEECAEPVTGALADDLAESLGFPRFRTGESGTTILILAPAFDDVGPALLEKMAQASLTSYWPRLIRGVNGKPQLELDLRWEGQKIVVPDPATVPGLAPFVEAYQALDSTGPSPLLLRRTEIEVSRPQAHTGSLVLSMVSPATPPNLPLDGAGPVDAPLRHIALMRGPGQVVRYLEGPPHPLTGMGYVGVFRCTPAVDGVFADAEPPTHDDWRPELVGDRTHRSIVNVTMERIRVSLKEFVTPTTDAGDGPAPPLAMLANHLGSLIAAESGPSPSVILMPAPPRSASEDRPRKDRGPRPQVVILGSELTCHENKRALAVSFRLKPVDGPVIVTPVISVVLDDGTRESTAPVGARRPHVLAWKGPNGFERVSTWRWDGRGVVEAIVFIEVPDELQLEIALEAKADKRVST